MLENNTNSNKEYYYGMKRYFDIGCQPHGQLGLCSNELINKVNDKLKRNVKILDIVRYENELSTEDILKFELIPINLKEIY
jgi:hypothetical protein